MAPEQARGEHRTCSAWGACSTRWRPAARRSAAVEVYAASATATLPVRELDEAPDGSPRSSSSCTLTPADRFQAADAGRPSRLAARPGAGRREGLAIDAAPGRGRRLRGLDSVGRAGHARGERRGAPLSDRLKAAWEYRCDFRGGRYDYRWLHLEPGRPIASTAKPDRRGLQLIPPKRRNPGASGPYALRRPRRLQGSPPRSRSSAPDRPRTGDEGVGPRLLLRAIDGWDHFLDGGSQRPPRAWLRVTWERRAGRRPAEVPGAPDRPEGRPISDRPRRSITSSPRRTAMRSARSRTARVRHRGLGQRPADGGAIQRLGGGPRRPVDGRRAECSPASPTASPSPDIRGGSCSRASRACRPWGIGVWWSGADARPVQPSNEPGHSHDTDTQSRPRTRVGPGTGGRRGRRAWPAPLPPEPEPLVRRVVVADGEVLLPQSGCPAERPPALYYTMLKGWMAVWGESVASLRVLGRLRLTVVAMGLFAGELYRASAVGATGKPAVDGSPGSWPMLVAVSPYQVFRSRRGCIHRDGGHDADRRTGCCCRPCGTRRGAGPGGRSAACGGLLYTHHYGLFTVAAWYLFLGLFAAWFDGCRQADRALAVVANLPPRSGPWSR